MTDNIKPITETMKENLVVLTDRLKRIHDNRKTFKPRAEAVGRSLIFLEDQKAFDDLLSIIDQFDKLERQNFGLKTKLTELGRKADRNYGSRKYL